MCAGHRAQDVYAVTHYVFISPAQDVDGTAEGSGCAWTGATPLKSPAVVTSRSTSSASSAWESRLRVCLLLQVVVFCVVRS
jgi:hypothetical protein